MSFGNRGPINLSRASFEVWLEELSILFGSSSYHVQPICTLASVVVNHPTLLFMFLNCFH